MSVVYHLVIGRLAGTAKEWAKYHWDTYGFELLSTRRQVVICVPTGDPKRFERELREDRVEFSKVPAKDGAVSAA